MKAFFYANDNPQIFDSKSTYGHRIIGELALEPGSYLVHAKTDIATSNYQIHPPLLPSAEEGGGLISLTLGGSNDVNYCFVKPEAVFQKNVSLMIATEIERPRRARLNIFLVGSPLKTIVRSVRISAIQVDLLDSVNIGTHKTGTDPLDPPSPDIYDKIVTEVMKAGIYVQLFGLPKDV